MTEHPLVEMRFKSMSVRPARALDDQTPAKPVVVVDADTPSEEALVSATPSRGFTRFPLALSTLAVLAVLYTLFFAREFLVPLTYAVMSSLVLSPVVRLLQRRARLPTPVGAAIVVVTLTGALLVGVYELSGPIQTWTGRAPEAVNGLTRKLQGVLTPVRRVQRTAEQVEKQAQVNDGKPATPVVVQGPTLGSRLMGATQRVVESVFEGIVLLYFLLAGGDLFLEKVISILPHVSDKKKAARIARDTERSISAYLVTVALINVSEGVLMTGVAFLLGMPTPAVWGVLVAMLEFVPYFGALTIAIVLTVVALTSFPSVGHALLVPGAFVLINLVQANFVTPWVMGSRLALNPVAVFLGLSFWFWIWSVPGALIAVPLLATFKVFCDHVESLATVGEFLGRRRPGAARHRRVVA